MSTLQNLRRMKRLCLFYGFVCVLLAFGMHSVLLFSQQLNYFNVSQSAGNSSNSRICFDSSNNLYVVWQDSTSIIRYRFFNKQSWSNIYEIYNSDTSSVLGVGITSFRDTCYVFWVEKNIQYYISVVEIINGNLSEVRNVYTSNNCLSNLQIVHNSNDIFVGWLEGDEGLYIHVLRLRSHSLSILGWTHSRYAYSLSTDDKDNIWLFWLNLNGELIYRTYSPSWSEPDTVYLSGAVPPLVEMGCQFNPSNGLFSFVFTSNIPTNNNYDSGLYYLEGKDALWRTIQLIDYVPQYITLPQIEIKSDGTKFVLYQEGGNGIPIPGSKFYLTKINNEGVCFSYANIAPDSTFLNSFVKDNKDSLYCSFIKYGDVYLANLEYMLTDTEKHYKSIIPDYVLEQNYPNPFNPRTNIIYKIPRSEKVEITLFNITGEKIEILFVGEQSPGTHNIIFDGHNLPSGLYFYQLKTNSFVQRRKCLLIK